MKARTATQRGARWTGLLRAASFVEVAIALACATASCSALDKLRAVDLELTGRVLDADTKEPIDGAYVIAVYKIVRVGPAAVASFCVKTKGMYTGQDGSYHFPVEKLDGRNPFWTQAIKSGYFWKTTTLHDSEIWARQDAAAYSGRDILLKKQDPARPDFQLGNGEEVCVDATTIEAAAAAIKYLQLELAEYVKYGVSEQQMRGTKNQIRIFSSSRPTRRNRNRNSHGYVWETHSCHLRNGTSDCLLQSLGV